MVEVPEPGAGTGFVLNATVTPLGCPEALRVMALSKPPETVVVIVDVPLLPCATLTDVGEAMIVKAAIGDSSKTAPQQPVKPKLSVVP
jgi:hypothetical protein